MTLAELGNENILTVVEPLGEMIKRVYLYHSGQIKCVPSFTFVIRHKFIKRVIYVLKRAKSSDSILFSI